MKALLAVAAAAAATPAIAQDYRDPYIAYEPLPSDAAVFSGVRIEVQAGYDRINDESGLVFADNGDGDDGVTYGGEVGFDLPVGRSLLLGGYAGLAGSTTEDCFGGVCTKPELTFTAGGRVGFALSPFTMVYAKGGYSRTRIELATPSFTDRDSVDGYHLGGGIEARFSPGAYGKLEYVYTQLRDYPVFSTGGGAGVDLDRHQVVAGLGLRL